MATKNTKVNIIVNSIAEGIINQELKPGERLIESKIAKKFNSSRIPVREALRLLEKEGYVIYNSFSSYHIKNYYLSNLEEILLLYKTLSKIILEKAIANFDSNFYKKAKKILSAINEAKDFKGYSPNFLRFFELVYGYAKMPFIKDTMMSMLHKNMVIVGIFYKEINNFSFPIGQYNYFLELCKKGEIKQAVLMWNNRHEKIFKELIKHFRKNNKKK
jgi:DNA-binding GntR family transcriptional regulator